MEKKFYINKDTLLENNSIQALLSDCTSAFIVDLDNDIATICYYNDYIKEHYTDVLSGNLSYSAGFEIFVNRQVYPDDRQIVLQVGKIDNVKEVLKQKDTFTLVYRTITNNKIKHCLIKLLKLQNEDVPHKILALFKDCNEEVQKQIGYRTNLNKERKNAEIAQMCKSTFLFNMSHDLRTPMNAIMGLTELAKKHINNPDRIYECLEKIGFASDNLLSLINDILDMTRLESGKIKSVQEIANLKLVIANLLEMMNSTAEMNNISLKCKYIDVTHTNLKIDVHHLNQILVNIIDNAIKYSKPNSEVELIITELDSISDTVASFEIQIKDSGIGMSEEFIGQMYEPFARQKNSTKSGIQGTGLGLSITKKLVSLLKGTISVESKENHGTTFTLTFNFPIKTETRRIKQLAEIKQDIKLKSELKKLTVLIVEDNELNREIAKDILIDNDINVIEAEDGSIAVDLISHPDFNDIDAILMDIQMPIMDGYEATKIIRANQNERISKLPIIALTANTFEEDKKNCFAVGMNDHISKPVSSKRLIEVLKKYCS